jgi:acyl-CoA reductase-like NAD-dependent aldehyde dehydrogenase
MEHPVAFEVQYREHQRRTAWINANDWQFETPEQRHRVRKAMAQALIALADALAPTESRETQPA